MALVSGSSEPKFAPKVDASLSAFVRRSSIVPTHLLISPGCRFDEDEEAARVLIEMCQQ